jgi:hypothetical protein
VEAKTGQGARPADIAGLRAVAGLPGMVRRIVVCQAERARRTPDGIDVLPVELFLNEIQAGCLWL